MNHMPRIRLTSFFFSLLVLILATAHGAIAEDKLTVAFEPYPPYEMFENGVARGMNVDIIREACSRIDVTPEFIMMSWSRALLELREGRIDAASSGFKTMERESYALYSSRPLSYEELVIIAPENSTVSLGSLNDLRRYRIGVVRQHSYGHEFDSMRGLDKDFSKTVKTQLDKMLHGRTDLLISNEVVIRHMLGEQPNAKVKTVFRVERTPLYLLFSRNAGDDVLDLSKRFSRHLKPCGMTAQ